MKKQTIPTIPMPRMTEAQLVQRYQYFGRRASQLCGTAIVNGKPVALGAAVAGFFDRMAKGLTDPVSIAQRNEFMDKVSKGDPEARRQFCALRLETYNNYVMAEMRWMQYFFNIINLGDDERPMEQNDYDKEIKCYFVGADGKPKIQIVEKETTEAFIPLRTITTPILRYKAVDIYRGNIVDVAVKTLTLSRDIANRMEAECKKLLDTIVGPFVFSGKKANWPFVANSYIDTDNLPTSNDVAVQGAKNYFDYEVLDEILNYAKLISAVMTKVTGGVAFAPTGRIRVPSKDIRYFGTFAPGSSTPRSVTPAAPLAGTQQQEVFEEGWGGADYKGIKWIFEPDATLKSDSKICYPEFTIKPGRVWLKPSQDREMVRTGEQDSNLFQENQEERQMKKVFAASINSATRILFARFNYGL